MRGADVKQDALFSSCLTPASPVRSSGQYAGTQQELSTLPQ